MSTACSRATASRGGGKARRGEAAAEQGGAQCESKRPNRCPNNSAGREVRSSMQPDTEQFDPEATSARPRQKAVIGSAMRSAPQVPDSSTSIYDFPVWPEDSMWDEEDFAGGPA